MFYDINFALSERFQILYQLIKQKTGERPVFYFMSG